MSNDSREPPPKTVSFAEATQILGFADSIERGSVSAKTKSANRASRYQEETDKKRYQSLLALYLQGRMVTKHEMEELNSFVKRDPHLLELTPQSATEKLYEAELLAQNTESARGGVPEYLRRERAVMADNVNGNPVGTEHARRNSIAVMSRSNSAKAVEDPKKQKGFSLKRIANSFRNMIP